MLDPATASGLPGTPLQDPTGEVIGDIEEVFLLPADGSPAWARVNAGDRTVVVPLLGAETTAGAVRAAFPRDAILEAPAPRSDGLDEETRQALHAHYGITDADIRDDSGFSADRSGARQPGATDGVQGDGMVPGHP